MKVNIMKGFIGYVFLLCLGGACIATGANTLGKNLPSAIFAIVLGIILLVIGVIMAVRKN